MNPPGIFKTLLEVSWQGSLVILLILVIRPLFGWRIPARWRSLLWTLALLRLLIPPFLLPATPASMQNLPVAVRPVERAELILDRAYTDYVLAPQAQQHQSLESDRSSLDPTPLATPIPRPVHDWWKIAAQLWLGGALLLALWIVGGLFRLRHRLAQDSGPVAGEIAELWQSCCQRLTIRRPPLLRETSAVDSPALVGVFRPLLLLPRHGGDTLSREDWEHILLHELAHYRRGDHWLQILHLATLCLHWFNPLVWFGLRQLRADREVAADEWALQHLSGERSLAYGSTLLKLLSAGHPPSFAHHAIGIVEDGAQMKRRLRRILAFRPLHWTGSLAGLVLVLVFGTFVFGQQKERADLAQYSDLQPAEVFVAAAGKGDLEILRKALDDGADVNAEVTLAGEKTALAAAAAANQMEAVRLLVTKGARVNPTEGKPSPALLAALSNGWPECADYLLAKGATCDRSYLAAARGESAEIDKILAPQKLDFETLKKLCEIAASNGRTEVFIRLHDAIRLLPSKSDWEPGDGAIVRAIARGHLPTVEALIARGATLNKYGVMRVSAALTSHPEMKELLAAKHFAVPEYSDGERLIDATQREDLPEIRRLLDSGVDINFCGEGGWTALTKASISGHERAVKLLLERGADPNAVKSPKWDYTPLCFAKTTKIADLLLAAGAKVDASLFGGRVHHLYYPVTFGPTAMVKWFLDHGVDPTKAKTESPTLLFSANNGEIAQLLIDKGVDVNARKASGQTALASIARDAQKPAETLQVLLEHGADANAADDYGFTPLMAARDGASVEVLVAHGADIHAVSKDGYGVLTVNPFGQESSRFEALLRHGVKFDPKTDGPAALARAAYDGHVDIVQLLLDKGVDPNAIPSAEQGDRTSGWTALQNAVLGKRPQIARLLLARGAKPETAVKNALFFGQPDILKFLRQAGARNFSDLCYAVSQSAPTAELEKILAKGSPVDPPEDEAVKPLSLATILGNLVTVRFLIEHGADPNAGKPGALKLAASRGRDEIFAYLLQHGGKADPSVVSLIANNSHPYDHELPIENFNRTMKLALEAGALDAATEEQVAGVLIAATFTRNPGGNPTVIKMLLDRGLDVHARTGQTVSFAGEPEKGKTQSVIDAIQANKTTRSWEVAPEVEALLVKAAEKPAAAR